MCAKGVHNTHGSGQLPECHPVRPPMLVVVSCSFHGPSGTKLLGNTMHRWSLLLRFFLIHTALKTALGKRALESHDMLDLSQNKGARH